MAVQTDMRSDVRKIKVDVQDLKRETKRLGSSVSDLQRETKMLGGYVADLQKQLSRIPVLWEKAFFSFRSQLFDKIDKDFLKPIKDLQQEDAAKEFRLQNHEERIEKLETASV